MPSRKRERQETDAEEGSRKKLKTSTTPDVMPQPVVDMKPDTDSLPPAPAPAPQHVTQEATQDFLALQILRGDFDDLRQLVTCKICERLLYEPYVLSCGHTYCYSCLSTWFATTKKKTCPNCREVITQPPAPSYVIKEMTHIFIRRQDLLPDEETVEQHTQWKEEESELVRNDKDSGGLFNDAFRARRPRLVPIHDPVDGVDRCPRCNWEVEDDMCIQCGIHMDRDSDSSTSESIDDDDDDEDIDTDLDELDGDLEDEVHDPEFMNWAAFGAPDDFDAYDTDNSHASSDAWVRRYNTARRMAPYEEFVADRLAERWRAGYAGFGERRLSDLGRDDMRLDDDEEDEEEEDEEEGSLNDFIDDRDPIDITTHTISSPEVERHPRGRNLRIVSSSDDEADVTNDNGPRNRRNRAVIVSSDDEDDGIGTTWPAPRMPVYEISDEEDEEGDSDVPRVIGSRPPQPIASRRERRKPVRIVESEDEEESGSEIGSGIESESRSEIGSESDAEPVIARETDIDSRSSSSSGDDELEEVSDDDSSGDDDDDQGSNSGGEEHEEYEGEFGGFQDPNDFEETEGSITNNGFSPIQYSDEDPETLQQFAVYGEGFDESD